MENDSNKISLLVLFVLFFMAVQQLNASQATKKVSMNLACAAKAMVTDRSSLYNSYPEDDSYNHTVMNGTYFDTRPFKNKKEKSQFVQHQFYHMQVKTDIDEIWIDLLTHNSYSRVQLTTFMHIAQQFALEQKSDLIKLVHLEKAFGEIEFGKIDTVLYRDACKTAHHEAGHAVINHIYDTGESNAWVSAQFYKGIFGYGYIMIDEDYPTDDQLRNQVKMLLAGGITEQVFGLPKKIEFDTQDAILRDFKSRGTSQDYVMAIAIIKKLAKNDQVCGQTNSDNQILTENEFQMMLDLYAATTLGVQNLQKEIGAVAQELLQEKVISGKRVKEIIDQVQLSKNK